MKKIILILLTLGICCFANQLIAKDSTPGGLYIIGPDVSPDSSEHTFLYYSPDGGYTLEIRDTLNWADAIDCIHFAVDYTLDVLYLNNILGRIYYSSNGGRDWEFRYNHSAMSCDDIKSGLTAGLVICQSITTFDYGLNWTIHYPDGWFGHWTDICEMSVPDLFYLENLEGVLFLSVDTFNHVDSIYTFETMSPLFRGVSGEQIFALSGYAILKTDDAGLSFDSVGSIYGLIPSGFSYELISGWSDSELFCVARKYNIIEMEGIKGGIIIIWRSSDYGETWELVRRYEAKVEERSFPQEMNFIAYPNPFNSSISITAPNDAEIEIYDIGGRIVGSGLCSRPSVNNDKTGAYTDAPLQNATRAFVWSPDENIPSGVYLVRARFDKLSDRDDLQIATKWIVFVK